MLFCNLEEEKNNMLDVSPSVASSLKKRKGKENVLRIPDGMNFCYIANCG